MKLAVVGGRTFSDRELLNKTLSKIHASRPVEVVVSGGASGADSLAKEWADGLGLSTLIFLPEWKRYGAKAGPIRNELIIKNSDAVVAFWNGYSPGTKSSINFAKEQNKPLLLVNYKADDQKELEPF